MNYECIRVKVAFVTTTQSTLQLHSALYNIAQNTLHVHTFFKSVVSKRGG
jgi:hypothetical protein